MSGVTATSRGDVMEGDTRMRHATTEQSKTASGKGEENKKIIREKKGKKPITIIIKEKKLKYSQHSVNIYKQNNDV